MAKRYRWLRLKEDFFNQKEIKKIRRIAGGDTYTIIYLKMQLLSLKDEGKLFYDEIEDAFFKELALILDEEEENVSVAINLLQKMGLLEVVDTDEYLLTKVPELIGSECDSAERVRKHREIKESEEKALQCNTDVTTCNTEKEKDIDIEKDKERDTEKKKKKHKYGSYEHVLLTDEEMNKLINELGEEMYSKCITFLDEYIEMKGYKAKSHYLVIKKWVVNAVNEQEQRKQPKKTSGIDWDNV